MDLNHTQSERHKVRQHIDIVKSQLNVITPLDMNYNVNFDLDHTQSQRLANKFKVSQCMNTKN